MTSGDTPYYRIGAGVRGEEQGESSGHVSEGIVVLFVSDLTG